MNNERKLLELAAKAAGISYKAWVKDWDGYEGLGIDGDARNLTIWNPLTDDGDALRLAVKLNLLVDCCSHSARGLPDSLGWRDGEGIDPYSATRRAIVRAAAEIGKDMK